MYNKTQAPSSLKYLKVPGFKFFQPLIYEAKEVIPDRDAVERLQRGEEPIADYGRVMQAASGGKLVLLEGPPGSGKSTVSRQLCRDWAVCELGTEFDLVVLVPLRELRKKEKVELVDLLRAAYGLPDGVVECIEAVDGNGVLFILDGYDEIKSQKEGVIEKLLRKSYLQHSSVIVTSRGIAAKSLYDKQHLDQRFVIQGLKKDQIPVFVRYYFRGSEANATEVQSLLDRLDADPRLIAACSNTLALSIVCYLHSQQEIIPSTMAGLYGRFLTITLREFVRRSPEPVQLPEIFQKYNRMNILRDLPSILRPGSPFSHLGAVAELALEGILQDKFVFESSDEMVPKFPEGFDGYGLLDSTVITDDFGLETKLYRLDFMHLTLQEFMAALLVASWTPENQTTFWKEHFALQYDGHVLSEDRFLTMFTFYCGLSGLEHKDVRNHLLEEVGNVWRSSEHFGQAPARIALTSLSHQRTLMRIAVASGNKEFVCCLLSPFGKKVEINVDNILDRANVVWCLNACKECFNELLVTYQTSVRTLAEFLSQLRELASLSVLQLPGMYCSTEHSESTCSEGRYTTLQWCTCVVCPLPVVCVYTVYCCSVGRQLVPVHVCAQISRALWNFGGNRHIPTRG